MAVMAASSVYTDYGRVSASPQSVEMITSSPVDVLEAEVGGADRFQEKNPVRRCASDNDRIEREFRSKVSVSGHRRVSLPIQPQLAHAHLSTVFSREASRSFWGMDMLYAREKRSMEVHLQQLSEVPQSLQDAPTFPAAGDSTLPLPLQSVVALKEGPSDLRSQSAHSFQAVDDPTNPLPLPSSISQEEEDLRYRSCSLESRPVILNWSPTNLKPTNAKGPRRIRLNQRRGPSLRKTSSFDC